MIFMMHCTWVFMNESHTPKLANIYSKYDVNPENSRDTYILLEPINN